MKTADLTGAQLDFWVAKAEGLDPAIQDGACHVYSGYYPANDRTGTWYSPHDDWAIAGPIIQREGIAVAPLLDLAQKAPVWFAWHEGLDRLEPADDYFERSTAWDHHNGPTPPIAAMRCFVTSKFGDELPAQTTGY